MNGKQFLVAALVVLVVGYAIAYYREYVRRKWLVHELDKLDAKLLGCWKNEDQPEEAKTAFGTASYWLHRIAKQAWK